MKKFREGQEMQILDTLFFDFIELGKRLKPKIIIAENVKGLISGEAKKYVKEIGLALNAAGYNSDKWLLDASSMGVPQKRERVFIIGIRKDLIDRFEYKKDLFSSLPYLNLIFNESKIPFELISDSNDREDNLSKLYLQYWNEAKEGGPVGKFLTNKKLKFAKVATTLTSRDRQYHPQYKRRLNDLEICKEQTFPTDYNFMTNNCNYLCGMSVPPTMTAQISLRIKEQWLDEI